MKKVAIIVGIVILVLIVIAVALPLFINVDSFRPQIEAKATAATGRKVELGKISFSLFSGGLSIDGISVADDPAFSQKPFLTAKSVNASVDMQPLIFNKELHLRSISINSPQIELISNAEGKWNYSSLNQTKPAPGAAAAPKPSANAPKGGEAQPGAAESLQIQELKITNGQVTMAEIPHSQPPLVLSDVDLSASNITTTSKFPFSLSLKTPKSGTLKAEGTAGPLNMGDTSLTPVELTLTNDKVDIAGLLPTSGMAGLLDLNAKFTSNGTQAHINGNGQVTNLKAASDGVPAKQPVALSYDTNYNLQSQQGNLSSNISVNKNTAKVTGTYSLRGPAMVVNLDVTGNGLSINELESLLPAFGVKLPSGSSLQGGTMSANLKVNGPLDKLVISGPVSLNNTNLAGFSLSSNMTALANIVGIKAGNDTTIQTFSSNVNVTPAETRADAINLIVPALGTVTGAGTVTNNNLNFNMVAKVQGTGQGLLASSKTQAIPFTVVGTTSNPKVNVNTNAVATSVLMDQLNSRVGGKGNPNANPQQQLQNALGGLLGGKPKK